MKYMGSRWQKLYDNQEGTEPRRFTSAAFINKISAEKSKQYDTEPNR